MTARRLCCWFRIAAATPITAGTGALGFTADCRTGRNVVAAWTGTAVMTVTGLDMYGNVVVEASASGTSLTGPMEIDRLALADLQGNVVHRGKSLYGSGPGGTVVPSSNGVDVGQLEMANATALDATVQMIGAQRQFETAMQAIQTYRRLDDQVLNVGKAR